MLVGEAALKTSEFGAMMAYDDASTLAIVEAMVVRSGRGLDEVLHDVGRSWVSFAKTTPFATLLSMAGRDFASVIANLDDMHARIRTSLPTMRPPSFSCELGEDGLLEVTYRSEREGLFPFVTGVFEGLAADFGQKLEIVAFEALSPSSAKWSLRCERATDHAA